MAQGGSIRSRPRRGGGRHRHGGGGAGGAKLFRRDFGELLENVAGRGEYHWMAGNFLKYGAEEGKFGKKTAAVLLGEFDSLEHLYDNLDKVGALPLRGAEGIIRKLVEHRNCRI